MDLKSYTYTPSQAFSQPPSQSMMSTSPSHKRTHGLWCRFKNFISPKRRKARRKALEANMRIERRGIEHSWSREENSAWGAKEKAAVVNTVRYEDGSAGDWE